MGVRKGILVILLFAICLTHYLKEFLTNYLQNYHIAHVDNIMVKVVYCLLAIVFSSKKVHAREVAYLAKAAVGLTLGYAKVLGGIHRAKENLSGWPKLTTMISS
jgi:hypothetical protein